MVTLDELEITTDQAETGWTASSTAYPDFTGQGETEDEAKQNLVDQINANESADAVNEGSEGNESTEG